MVKKLTAMTHIPQNDTKPRGCIITLSKIVGNGISGTYPRYAGTTIADNKLVYDHFTCFTQKLVQTNYVCQVIHDEVSLIKVLLLPYVNFDNFSDGTSISGGSWG